MNSFFKTSFIFLIVSSVQYSIILNTCNGENQGVAAFIFGDSLVDVGNNNYIFTLSKADYPPNGIDFGWPTGRFTNNRTIPDIIGQQLGYNAFPPPYLAPSTRGIAIVNGVNYASGSAGILNSTSQLYIERVNMDAQLDNYANTRNDLIVSIGEEAANKFLEKALYAISIGSTDLLTFLLPLVSTIQQTPTEPQAFVDAMISKFRVQLTRLLKMGAKKLVIANIGPIGCIPYLREQYPTAGDNCVEAANQLAQMFNLQLKSLVYELSYNFQASKLVYADVYHISHDLLMNYMSYGFQNANSACCYMGGRYRGLIPCNPLSKVCNDRSKYVFWDNYHPSDAANVIIANQLIDGDSSVISPINIRQLLFS